MEKNKSRWKKGSSGEVGVERGAVAVINRVEGEGFLCWMPCLGALFTRGKGRNRCTLFKQQFTTKLGRSFPHTLIQYMHSLPNVSTSFHHGMNIGFHLLWVNIK